MRIVLNARCEVSRRAIGRGEKSRSILEVVRHGSVCTLVPSSNGPARCGMGRRGEADDVKEGRDSVGLT